MKEISDYYDTVDTSPLLEQAVLEEPDIANDPMVTYALRLPQPLLAELRNAASERGVRVSELMRSWLEERIA